MILNYNKLGKQNKGSSLIFSAHWEGGARATLKMIAPQKNLSEAQAKKFSFPFRRKNRARAKSKKQRKFFCGARERSERRRGGASKFAVRILKICGRYRIRTCEGLRPRAFQARALNHSANLPPCAGLRFVSKNSTLT